MADPDDKPDPSSSNLTTNKKRRRSKVDFEPAILQNVENPPGAPALSKEHSRAKAPNHKARRRKLLRIAKQSAIHPVENDTSKSPNPDSKKRHKHERRERRERRARRPISAPTKDSNGKFIDHKKRHKHEKHAGRPTSAPAERRGRSRKRKRGRRSISYSMRYKSRKFPEYYMNLRNPKKDEDEGYKPLNLNQYVKTTKQHMFGSPLQELDPFVFDDSYCVISTSFNKHHIYRFSTKKTLFLLHPFNPIRQFCVLCITHQVFEVFIFLTIIANCIVLAYDDNELECKDGVCHLISNEFPHWVEWAFLGIYTLEMILKVLAKGFIFGKFSYMKSPWNVIDFLVILLGVTTETFAQIYSKSFDMDIFKTFRVFRAIKTISIMPGLRALINALLHSLVQLVEVIGLTFLCLCVFSLFALEVFSGKLHHVCVLNKGSETAKQLYQLPYMEPISPNDPVVDQEYQQWVIIQFNWLERDFPETEHLVCGNDTGSRQCPNDYTCLADLGENPDNDWTSFDNIFNAMLSTFQLITLDYWERLYDLLMSALGPWSMPFFIFVVFLGSFYLLNLVLAVVSKSYEAEEDRAQKEKDKYLNMTKRQKLALHRTDSNFSLKNPLNYKLALLTEDYIRQTPEEREEIAKAKWTPSMIEIHKTLHKKKVNMDVKSIMKKFEEDRKAEAHLTPEERRQKLEEKRALTIQKRRERLEKEEREEEEKIAYEMEETGMKVINQDEIDGEEPILLIEYSSSDYDLPTPPKLDFDEWDLYYDESIGEEDIGAFKKHKLQRIADKYATKAFILRETVLRIFVRHKYFEQFITICIVLNTIMVAFEHHGQPLWLENLINTGSNCFMVVFAFEAVIKIIALHFRYFNDAWNIFDLIIVLFSLVDYVSQQLDGPNGFRVMRLLRILKVAQSWQTMKILLDIIFSTFGALGYLTLLLTIVLYIFAVLGMQTIGRSYVPKNFRALSDTDDEFPRWNFKTFGYAFMMIFRVLCGEWVEPLWECFHAHEDQNSEWKCFFIFLPAYLIGNIILLNLFLALLLNSFSAEELLARRDGTFRNKEEEMDPVLKHKLDKTQQQKLAGEVMGKAAEARRKMYQVKLKETDSKSRRTMKKATLKLIVAQRKKKAMVAIKRMEGKQKRDPLAFKKARLKLNEIKKPVMNFGQNTEMVEMYQQQIEDKNIYDPLYHSDASSSDETKHDDPFHVKLREPPDCFPICAKHSTCNCWNRFRYRVLQLVTSCIFEYTVLALIVASSITLCFEDIYLEQNPELKSTLFKLNLVFTSIFLVEMLLKWLAFGITRYFTQFWTILDGVIVMISVASLAFDIIEMHAIESGVGIGEALEAFRSIRTLRALRPLRAISRWEGMRVVVNALVFSIPSIFNVLLVCLFFWLIFAIMGVNLFKGKFYRCVDSNGGVISPDEIDTKEKCCNSSRGMFNEDELTSWINVQPNFDNVFWAYLALFQIATFEGWMEIMAAATDITEVDQQPRREISYSSQIYFVVFIIFGSFFTLNLFIGVIIDNFNLLKNKHSGSVMQAFLTPYQQTYYATLKKLAQRKPTKAIGRPQCRLLLIFYNMSVSRRFEIAIFLLIFGNMLTMAFETHNQDILTVGILNAFNDYFTAMYALECLIKIIGLRQHYFKIPWNVFDFILVLLSMLDWFIIDEVNFPFPPTLLRVIRVVRIGRVLRLVKSAKGIQQLIFALVVSLPALFNIGALLALINFIFAILGMSLFKDVTKVPPLDDYFNFETLYRTSILLFRLQTAAGWNEVLDALLQNTRGDGGTCGSFRQKCGHPGEPECMSIFQPITYMVSYLVVTYLIIINMYIAIILENFDEAHKEGELRIAKDDIDSFYAKWAAYDPNATQFINFGCVSDFLNGLDVPLRFKKPNRVVITAFDLPITVGNKIHCLDILKALVLHLIKEDEDSVEVEKLKRLMEKEFRRKFLVRKHMDIISSTGVWNIRRKAAIVIQRAWRTYLILKYPDRYKDLGFDLDAIFGPLMLHYASEENQDERPSSSQDKDQDDKTQEDKKPEDKNYLKLFSALTNIV